MIKVVKQDKGTRGLDVEPFDIVTMVEHDYLNCTTTLTFEPTRAFYLRHSTDVPWVLIKRAVRIWWWSLRKAVTG